MATTTADHQDLDGERYTQGYTGDAAHVTAPYPPPMTTTAFTALAKGTSDAGYTYLDTVLGKVMEWNGYESIPAQTRTSTGHAHIRDDSVGGANDDYVVLELIPATTGPADPLAQASWATLSGYSDGCIWVNISDVTPASDLTGNIEISYSIDAGVTFTSWTTLQALAGAAGDDDEDIMVNISSLKRMPYFKIRINQTAGTWAAVVVKAYAYLERRYG